MLLLYNSFETFRNSRPDSLLIRNVNE